ncbi:MAG TPA: hypothetical protein VLV86_25235 [Vicinamibacterales bacterium]|nr:hypothetical protein [Vicinamibacterales bacterium]
MSWTLVALPRVLCVAAALTFCSTSSRAQEGESGPPAKLPAKVPAPIHRTADGTPDLTGMYQHGAGGANYGLERHDKTALIPGGAGVIIDPPDGKLPMQEWARAEVESRGKPERGYDDPTAHCFPAGVPRELYVPQPIQILQPRGYLIFLFERMSWRTVPLDGRAHIPDSIRLWQGDSVGHWEGDTLVIDTTNFNGKTWLNQNGEAVSHAEHVVERLTPVDGDTITYEATVTDPVVYTRSWTIRYPLRRQRGELLEVACHEDDVDLEHLKAIKDAANDRSVH